LRNEYSGEEPPRRKNVAAFFLIASGSLVAAILLILAVPYYAGSSTRIASLYTNVANPADRALTGEVSAYTLNERHDLAAAKLALSQEVKTETSFDNQLGDITFPSAPDPHADLLTAADAKRIKLLKQQMLATSLRKLRAFDSRDQAANAAVEAQVRIIRADLGLPPADGDGELY
jgi:hypothetical protein